MAIIWLVAAIFRYFYCVIFDAACLLYAAALLCWRHDYALGWFSRKNFSSLCQWIEISSSSKAICETAAQIISLNKYSRHWKLRKMSITTNQLPVTFSWISVREKKKKKSGAVKRHLSKMKTIVTTRFDNEWSTQMIFNCTQKLARKHWDHAGRFEFETQYSDQAILWTASSPCINDLQVLFKCCSNAKRCNNWNWIVLRHRSLGAHM